MQRLREKEGGGGGGGVGCLGYRTDRNGGGTMKFIPLKSIPFVLAACATSYSSTGPLGLRTLKSIPNTSTSRL